jgi:hypothetical protein
MNFYILYGSTNNRLQPLNIKMTRVIAYMSSQGYAWHSPISIGIMDCTLHKVQYPP